MIDGVGQADGAVRTAAIIVLLAFGVLLLAPPLADRLEAALSPLARLGPRGRGDGLWSGRASAPRWASSTRRAPGQSSRR